MQPRVLISLASIQFVNFIFLYKYLHRITTYPFTFAFSIIVFQTMLYFPIKKYINAKNLNFYLTVLILALYSLCMLYALSRISIYNLNVDRWSVVASFWDTWFSGNYPYLAHSHLGNYPGPMPFYFLLLLPYHLAGELGYVTILTVIALFFILDRKLEEKNLRIYLLILILGSAPVLWEIVCRSAILFNSVLILAYFILAEKYSPSTIRRSLFLGAIGGLLLSTRNVFSVSFIFLAFYFLIGLKIKLQNILCWAIAVIVTFAATFLPLILQFGKEFLVMNPFIIQSSFLVPRNYVFVFMVGTVVLGFYCSNFKKTIFINGLALLSISLIYASYLLIKYGFNQAYLESEIDISYFIFSLPFFYYTLINENTKTEIKTSQLVLP